ncbi:hypothetical protein BH18ACT11_BH18ACT11_22750 [soil metagenome]
MILAVIFDLDGTLVETEELKALSYARAARELRPTLRVYERLLADHDLIVSHRYPHNIALLHEVRRLGYPTALSTMSHPGQVRHVLSILGLGKEFDVVATRAGCRRRCGV